MDPGRDEVALNLQNIASTLLSLNLFLMEKCSLIEKQKNMFLAILCGLVGMVKCLSDPFKAGMTSNEGIKRSLLNHRVVFLNTESVLVFFSPAAA